MMDGTVPGEIVLSGPSSPHPDARAVEIVERKGRAHPDSICDALAEAFSIALTRAYHERCGRVLHHNVDKVLLAAGSSAPRVGGGRILRPIEIFLAGRATSDADGVAIDVPAIGIETSRAWLAANIHALDVERHVRIHPLVQAGSAALSALLPRSQTTAVVANDTSLAVGYAPASRLERVVLAVEHALTDTTTIARYPMIGEDVKVLGIRRHGEIDVTVACAMVDRHVGSLAEYAHAKELVAAIARRAAAAVVECALCVTVNAADDVASNRNYLTVTGTSAESGDDGEVGRGNRVGGLITPYRPMTLEAAAGKNVVAHVGKSYNIAAHRIARELVARVSTIAEATCFLASRIGSPIDHPQLIEIQVRLHDDRPLEAVREQTEAITRRCLRELALLPQQLLASGTIVCPAKWPGVDLF